MSEPSKWAWEQAVECTDELPDDAVTLTLLDEIARRLDVARDIGRNEQEAAMRRLARDYAQAVQDLGRMRSAAIREAAENL